MPIYLCFYIFGGSTYNKYSDRYTWITTSAFLTGNAVAVVLLTIWYILFMYVLILIFLHYNLHQKEITPLEQFMSMMKENLSNAYHSFRSMSISSSSVAESHNNNNHQHSKDLENSSVSNTTISSLRASLLHSQSFRDSISSSQPSSSQHDIHQIVKTPIYSNQNSYYERKKNHPSFSQQYQQHNNNPGQSQSIKGTSFSSEPRLSERISERMVIPSDRSSLSWKMNQADLTSSPLSGLVVSPPAPAVTPPSSSGQQTENNSTKKTTRVTIVQANDDKNQNNNNDNGNNGENPTIEEDPENEGKDGIDEKRASYFTNPFRRSSAATGTRFSVASSMNQLRQSTIAVLNVDHLQELVHDAEFQNRLQYFFLYLLVMTINITVSISVNAGYLILQNSHNVSSQGKVIVQVIMAFFKLFWNIVAIRRMVNWLQPFEKSVTRLHVGMLVFNSIVAPGLATGFTDSSCFQEVFMNTETITSSYTLTTCIESYETSYGEVSSTICTHYDTVTYETEFTPSFIYYYTCGTKLLTVYTPVFIYTYTILLISSGFLYFLLSSLETKVIPHWILVRIDGLLRPNDRGKVIFERLIRAHSIEALLTQHIIVLLTFGINSPILAVIMAVTISFDCLLWQLIALRYIKYECKSCPFSPDYELPTTTTERILSSTDQPSQQQLSIDTNNPMVSEDRTSVSDNPRMISINRQEDDLEKGKIVELNDRVLSSSPLSRSFGAGGVHPALKDIVNSQEHEDNEEDEEEVKKISLTEVKESTNPAPDPLAEAASSPIPIPKPATTNSAATPAAAVSSSVTRSVAVSFNTIDGDPPATSNTTSDPNQVNRSSATARSRTSTMRSQAEKSSSSHNTYTSQLTTGTNNTRNTVKNPLFVLLSDLDPRGTSFTSNNQQQQYPVSNSMRKDQSVHNNELDPDEIILPQMISIQQIFESTITEQTRLNELNTLIDDAWLCLYNARWLLFYCSTIFNTCILFDFAGDQLGWQASMWVVAVMMTLIILTRLFFLDLMVYVYYEIYLVYFEGKQSASTGLIKDDAAQQQEQDHGRGGGGGGDDHSLKKSSGKKDRKRVQTQADHYNIANRPSPSSSSSSLPHDIEQK